MTDALTFRNFSLELMAIILDHAASGNGLEGQELLEHRKAENAALVDKLKQQRRALSFFGGEDVPPEMQFGNVIMVPKIGEEPV